MSRRAAANDITAKRVRTRQWRYNTRRRTESAVYTRQRRHPRDRTRARPRVPCIVAHLFGFYRRRHCVRRERSAVAGSGESGEGDGAAAVRRGKNVKQ